MEDDNNEQELHNIFITNLKYKKLERLNNTLNNKSFTKKNPDSNSYNASDIDINNKNMKFYNFGKNNIFYNFYLLKQEQLRDFIRSSICDVSDEYSAPINLIDDDEISQEVSDNIKNCPSNKEDLKHASKVNLSNKIIISDQDLTVSNLKTNFGTVEADTNNNENLMYLTLKKRLRGACTVNPPLEYLDNKAKPKLSEYKVAKPSVTNKFFNDEAEYLVKNDKRHFFMYRNFENEYTTDNFHKNYLKNLHDRNNCPDELHISLQFINNIGLKPPENFKSKCKAAKNDNKNKKDFYEMFKKATNQGSINNKNSNNAKHLNISNIERETKFNVFLNSFGINRVFNKGLMESDCLSNLIAF